MLGNDNSDFDAAFAEASAEVEAGGGIGDGTIPANAKVHLGDGVVIDPQNDSSEGQGKADEDDDETVDQNVSDGNDLDDESSGDVFDWAANKDKSVKVKVNGTEVTVPLGEAMSGYMRQSDYTRKTQELSQVREVAEWGETMRNALKTNPQFVVRGLAEAFGVTLDGSAPVDPYASDDPELQPVLQRQKHLEAKLQEQQSYIDSMQQDQILASVRQEIASVTKDHPDFDASEVLPVAMKTGLSIEESYFLVRGSKQESKAADAAKAEAKARRLAQREADARLAASKVASGSQRAPMGAAPDAEPQFDNIADMLNFELERSR